MSLDFSGYSLIKYALERRSAKAVANEEGKQKTKSNFFACFSSKKTEKSSLGSFDITNCFESISGERAFEAVRPENLKIENDGPAPQTPYKFGEKVQYSLHKSKTLNLKELNKFSFNEKPYEEGSINTPHEKSIEFSFYKNANSSFETKDYSFSDEEFIENIAEENNNIKIKTFEINIHAIFSQKDFSFNLERKNTTQSLNQDNTQKQLVRKNTY